MKKKLCWQWLMTTPRKSKCIEKLFLTYFYSLVYFGNLGLLLNFYPGDAYPVGFFGLTFSKYS